MARGWESKSVEEQIQLAKAREGTVKNHLTPEQIDLERKRDSLLLQRTRMVHEIAGCSNDRHRQTLENGLAYLDSQLALLGLNGR